MAELTTRIAAIKTEYGKYFKLFSYSMMSIVFQQLPMPFIILPFLSRMLSKSEFGELTIVISMIIFCTTVLSGPMVMSLYRHHGDIVEEEKPVFYGSVIKLSLLFISLIGFLMLFIEGPLFARWEIGFSMNWFIPLLIYMITLFINSMLSTIFRIQLRFSFLMWCNCIYLLLSPLVIFAYYLVPHGAWTWGLVFAPVVVSAIMLIALVREDKIKLTGKATGIAKGILKSSLMFFIAALLANLLIYSDRWLLAEYRIPKAEIAFYSVAIQACTLVLVIIDQISEVVLPIISNLNSYNDLTSAQARKILALSFYSMLFIAFCGIPAGFFYIRVFYGEAFWLHGRILFYILIGGMTFYPLQLFSRALVIRFHTLSPVVCIYAAACVAFLVSIYFLHDNHGIFAFAVSRAGVFMGISISFFTLALRPLIRKMKSPNDAYKYIAVERYVT